MKQNNLLSSGPTSPQSSKPSKKRKVYDLRSKVKYWSDYLRPHLHPATISLLPSVWHWQVAGCADADVSSLLPSSRLENVKLSQSTSGDTTNKRLLLSQMARSRGIIISSSSKK